MSVVKPKSNSFRDLGVTITLIFAALLLVACSTADRSVTRAELTEGIESLDGVELVEFLWESDVVFSAQRSWSPPELIESDEPIREEMIRFLAEQGIDPESVTRDEPHEQMVFARGEWFRYSDGRMSGIQFSGIDVDRRGDRVHVRGEYRATVSSEEGSPEGESAGFSVSFERLSNGLSYTSSEVSAYQEAARAEYLTRLRQDRED